MNISKNINNNNIFIYSLVESTIKNLSENRRCFRKVGGVLVEKDLASIKKDLSVEISNIKATLDVVYKSMKQQEEILAKFEKTYGDVLRGSIKKEEEKKEKVENKESGGVLV